MSKTEVVTCGPGTDVPITDHFLFYAARVIHQHGLPQQYEAPIAAVVVI